jgi:hypothetical protein
MCIARFVQWNPVRATRPTTAIDPARRKIPEKRREKRTGLKTRHYNGDRGEEGRSGLWRGWLRAIGSKLKLLVRDGTELRDIPTVEVIETTYQLLFE